MAVKDNKESMQWMQWHAKKMILGGSLLFIAGLVRYLGYDWSVVLMVVGALILIKGLVKKRRWI